MESKNKRQWLADISREFLKIHKVHRYRMKKIQDMDDDEVIQKCHWYYEENHLIEEWIHFCKEKESSAN